MKEEDAITDLKVNMTDKKIRRYSAPNYRSVRRPEEVLRDVRGLKLRQRVSLVLSDEVLREELEDSIKNTANAGTNLDYFRTYQDLLLPVIQPSVVSLRNGASVTLPINDIRGENTSKYTKYERALRCKLAAVYRLIDLNGWSEAIFNHVSVRVSKDKEEFLLNPFGLLFSEITSSSLVSCDLQGDFVDKGSTLLGINKAGFVLHSTIHEARPDIQCIIHVHTPDVVAVSAMKCGFLRISQESLIVGGVSYHDYWGILIDITEKESIINDLGPKNMVMFLRNHGVVVCGDTIENAYRRLFTLMEACTAQVKAVSIGIDNLNIISEEAYEQVQVVDSHGGKTIFHGEGKPHMTLDELYFESQMRWLDAQGYRTGYIYHLPEVFVGNNSSKKVPEARLPPQAASDRDMPYHVYHDFHQNNMRSPSLGIGNTHRNKMRWLNSPVQGTQYKREARESNENTILEDPVDHILTNGHLEETPNGHPEESPNGHREEVSPEPTPTIETTPPATPVKGAVVVKVEDKLVINAEGLTLSKTENTADNSPLHKSSSSLTQPSETGSTAESELSPQKVKKQKSFKKALLKKLHKKEEKTK